MEIYVNIIEPKDYKYAKFTFQRFDNGKASCYFDAESGIEGYGIHGELTLKKQVVLANVFMESVLNTSLERLSYLANSCRTLNENPELSSMLAELDSYLEELNTDNFIEQ